MEFVKKPNLPEGRVKWAIADGRIDGDIEEGLKKNGVGIIKTYSYPGTYDAICCHPDILLHHLGEERIIYAPGVDVELISRLASLGFRMIRGETALGAQYPGNVAYNAARIGSFLFHNLKFTDPLLKREMENSNVELVHVNQGYTKCSVSIVNEKSIITSDRGIAKEAEKRGIEVLLIQPDSGIKLPGLDMGFIGGCSGLIGPKRWAVTGNLKNLKSYGIIKNFLCSKGVELCCLSRGMVVDTGSILPIITE
ncbi:MAG: hypothetical protein N2489_07965 [Clostridia bacterium]|nr:hypothetical protein [Clostridia bacterium]